MSPSRVRCNATTWLRPFPFLDPLEQHASVDRQPIDQTDAASEAARPEPDENGAAAGDELLGELCDQVVAAGRRGDLAVVAVLAAEIARRTGSDEQAATAATPPAPAKRPAVSPARADLASRMAAREAGVSAALSRSFPDAPADEQLLHDLAAERAGLAVALRDAQARLAVRLPALLGDARTAKVAASVLKDLLGADAMIASRIESSLSMAATLRLQRRMAAAARR
jgi:hypothetical protein